MLAGIPDVATPRQRLSAAIIARKDLPAAWRGATRPEAGDRRLSAQSATLTAVDVTVDSAARLFHDLAMQRRLVSKSRKPDHTGSEDFRMR